mgnify:CR=1 FL=1
MLTKLLVAVDGSAQSYKGVDLALKLARNEGSEVILLEVIHPIPVYGPAKKTLQQSIEERNRDMAAEVKEDLAKVGKKFDELQIPYQTKAVIGSPAEEICRIAEEEKVTMIIIGTRGKTGVSRFLMGSVSSQVVTHARCSVLVTR